MIEIYENAIQLAVLLFCVNLAIMRSVRYHNQIWIFLALAYSGFVLGDCYWLACLIFFGDTPQIALVSDLSWYTFYLFLYLMLKHVLPEDIRPRKLLPWLGPVFTVAMAVFFMQWGNYLSNTVTAVLMGLLLYQTIGGLCVLRDQSGDNRRALYWVTLVYCLLNYALWVVSCFWDGDTLANPYYWVDILMTLWFPFFLPATGKAVKA